MHLWIVSRIELGRKHEFLKSTSSAISVHQLAGGKITERISLVSVHDITKMDTELKLSDQGEDGDEDGCMKREGDK
jgi:hypothetical protein